MRAASPVGEREEHTKGKDCRDYAILGAGRYWCPKYRDWTPRPCAWRCPCDHEEA